MQPAEPWRAGEEGGKLGSALRPGCPRRLPVALLAVPALAAFLPAGARAQRTTETLVDRVAVVVEGPSARDRSAQVVTLWDLFVSASIEIIRRAGPDAPLVPVDLDGIREAQSRAVEQLVALREAGRLGRDEVPPSAVDEARDGLAVRIGGHDALRAFLSDRSISMELLDAALQSEVIVDRFTRDSVRLPAAMNRLELEQQFAAGGHPFQGYAYAEVAAEFEAWVQQEQFQEYRRLWLVDLRSRCRLIVRDVDTELVSGATGGVREGPGIP